jgi:hypothetical protein
MVQCCKVSFVPEELCVGSTGDDNFSAVGVYNGCVMMNDRNTVAGNADI